MCWKPLTFADAGLVRVERNFMHHNARNSGGYGWTCNGGSFVTIIGNVFNYNRHAVTATAGPLRLRRALQLRVAGRISPGPIGAIGYGGYYNQHMDVHGAGAGGEWRPRRERSSISR